MTIRRAAEPPSARLEGPETPTRIARSLKGSPIRVTLVRRWPLARSSVPFPRGQRTTHSKLLLLSARQRAGALWRCDLLGGGLVLKVLPLVRDHPQDGGTLGYTNSWSAQTSCRLSDFVCYFLSRGNRTDAGHPVDRTGRALHGGIFSHHAWDSQEHLRSRRCLLGAPRPRTPHNFDGKRFVKDVDTRVY